MKLVAEPLTASRVRVGQLALMQQAASLILLVACLLSGAVAFTTLPALLPAATGKGHTLASRLAAGWLAGWLAA